MLAPPTPTHNAQHQPCHTGGMLALLLLGAPAAAAACSHRRNWRRASGDSSLQQAIVDSATTDKAEIVAGAVDSEQELQTS